jgi:predicted transcriptional regulator
MQNNFNQIVHQKIKKSNYTFSKIAKELFISRNTLYKKLKSENLDLELVQKIGNLINFDFKDQIPSLLNFKKNKCLCEYYKNRLENVFEKYNQLLYILNKKIKNKNFSSLKREIQKNNFIL